MSSLVSNMFFRSRQPQSSATPYISRDLSWMKFNQRVLDQAKDKSRGVLDRLKFLAITASNLDEFFQIRVGSLYNYIDYGKERIDYSGLREHAFRIRLLNDVQQFYKDQNDLFVRELIPSLNELGIQLAKIEELTETERESTAAYFRKTIYPMLTPMAYDSYHSFPILMNKILTMGVVTRFNDGQSEQRRVSFVQIPQNLPRFYEIEREDETLFVPIQEIIRWKIDKLFRNVQIVSVDLFRITRNGDFSVEESDDMEDRYIDEIKRKLQSRKTGRVVRMEVEPGYNEFLMKLLMDRWEIDKHNVVVVDALMDFTSLFFIVNHPDFKQNLFKAHSSVKPLSFPTDDENINLFEYLKKRDVLLHQPFNNVEPLIHMLERAAVDPQVLAIKITIYRLAKNSRISNALLKAAENGKHVSVLFEVKARFDEENNIKEAQRLQKAGCYVIYGFSKYKTHCKIMMIVRKDEDGDGVTRYVHLSSGNYNEETARFYTDLGLLTTNDTYAHDVSEFFNVITGHSMPMVYKNLITAPGDMRKQLIELVDQEAENARKGLASGIVIKVNSLQDQEIIDAFYRASQAGVPIKLIIRGMCCLKPGVPGMSETIQVRSIVGDFLEHSRLYYFHNAGSPTVYGGSAFKDPFVRQEVINVLQYNLKDNVNAYDLNQDGDYIKAKPGEGESPFDIHKEFFNVTKEDVLKAKLF
jgi:polyphosphate kinase